MVCTEDAHQTKGHIQTESEGLENDTYANGDQKKAVVEIFISDNIDFAIKTIKSDKERYYIMIKGSI